MKIFIATDEEEYLSHAGRTSGIIEFSEAFFNPGDQTIYIRNPRKLKNFSSLHRILLHEYVHLLVAYYWQDTPLWFNEGMAVYFSNDLSINREFNFVINYILGNSRKLAEMTSGYPVNSIEWESFYAHSALAVKYLYTRKRRNFIYFWDLAFPGRNFTSAFTRAFLITPTQYSRIFENYARSHFRMEILLATTGLIWSILPLVLIAGFIRKKIINRKVKRGWEVEEYEEDKSEDEI
ncbi:MAG: hypothetical protein JXB60_06530 [Candidatus Cloacimonetes bacterium]|nr:hypothetical protein [Candidatus Cloacimonadota bacterium]